MGLIAEFSVSSPKLALYEATTAVPTVTLELTDLIATDPQRPQVGFWATGDGLAEFDRALAEDWTVTDIATHTELDDRRLYRAQLTEEVDVVSYPVWVEAGASRLASTCEDGVWRNRMRFPDRERFNEVRSWCGDNDLSFELHRLYTDTGSDGTTATTLSPKQERTALRAYEAGYYEIPRQTSAADISDELGISRQAASDRLRRAHAGLIEEYLLDEPGRRDGSE